MSRRDPRARAMLRAYRETTGYAPRERDALWGRIESSLDGAEAGPALEGPPSAMPRWLLLGVGVGVAVVAAAVLLWAPWRGTPSPRDRSQQAPRTRREPAPQRVEPPRPPAVGVTPTEPGSPTTGAETSASPPAPPPQPGPADPRGRSRATTRRTQSPPAEPPPASTVDELRAELVLIAKARQALRAEDPRRALEVLDAHARAFPQGQMREDRLVLRIEALCAAGKAPQASAEARLFLRGYPGSAHAQRVRDACAGLP